MRYLKAFKETLAANEVKKINYRLPSGKAKNYILVLMGKGNLEVSFTKNNRKENLISKLICDFPDNTLIFPTPILDQDDPEVLQRLTKNRIEMPIDLNPSEMLKGTVFNTEASEAKFSVYLIQL